MITYCGKKMNIYYREPDKITRIDIFFTYLFLITTLLIIIIYSYKYYEIVDHDMILCEKHNTHRSCLKSEISMIIVPYVGTTYGFVTTFYKLTDVAACLLGCVCCCKPISTKNSDVTIEMNPV
tara:strand:+ start:49 stop:417 length:369 start_codon:yes stop_codon:yes gene_type:complete